MWCVFILATSCVTKRWVVLIYLKLQRLDTNLWQILFQIPFTDFYFPQKRKNNAVQENSSVGGLSTDHGTNLYDNFIYLLVSGQKKRYVIKVINYTVQIAICPNFYANLSYVFTQTDKLYSNTFKLQGNPLISLFFMKLNWCIVSDLTVLTELSWSFDRQKSNFPPLSKSVARLLITTTRPSGSMKRYIDQDKCAVWNQRSIPKTGAERALLTLFGESLDSYFDGRNLDKGTLVNINDTLRRLEEDKSLSLIKLSAINLVLLLLSVEAVNSLILNNSAQN